MEIDKAIKDGIVICDGAMGTELQRRGLKRGETPDSWNITHPEQVKGVHQDYIRAGSNAILTNTFGASLMRLPTDSQYSVQELNQAAVKNARECAGDDVLVFGDIGPSGKEDQLPPYGTEPESNYYDSFKEQAVVLSDSGVDAIMVETMSNLTEAKIAVKVVVENTSKPVLCSMAFARPPASRPEDIRTAWGDALSDIIKELTELGVSALGSNCGDLVEEMPLLAAKMRDLTELPLIFQVNAGRPKVDDQYRSIYSLEPEGLAEIALQLKEAGANIIGGCCGTTPAHIAAIREKL
ncbi:hypothetical protein GF312_20175 [Candidatus Poribacteria bacterium]|nr:hypothetical protein [Candidatus Poribacteria bacterium]